MKLLARIACALLLPLFAWAANPVLIRDLDTTVPHPAVGVPEDTSRFPVDTPFARLGGVALFAGVDPFHGTELWRTDGTAAGTFLVKDIHPSGSSSPTAFVTLGTHVFFIASDGSDGPQIWRTDGNAGGTRPLVTFDVATRILDLYVAGPYVYFTTIEHKSGQIPFRLWRTDGTSAGTVALLTMEHEPAPLPVAASNKLFFITAAGGTGEALWVSDGSVAGTQALVGASNSVQPVEMKGLVYFACFDATGGLELCRTDGNPAGTFVVKDIYPGAGNSTPGQLAVVDNLLFFFAADPVSGMELWKTDGTTAGTVLVKDITPGPNGTIAGTFAWASRGLYFFTAYDLATGQIWLYRSNGSAAGTFPLHRFAFGPFGEAAADLVDMGTYTAFRGTDANLGTELWRTDGTVAGTALVADIQAGAGSSRPFNLTNLGATLVFSAEDVPGNRQLWKSDGTTAGTVLLATIDPPLTSSIVAPLAGSGDLAFFAADDGITGQEVWRSDGTVAGTYLVKDVNPHASTAPIGPFAILDHQLYFAEDDGVHGKELWKTDGSAAGTVFLGDIAPGTATPNFSALVPLDGALLFAAWEPTDGRELWRTDGTAAGTALVSDLLPGPGWSSPAIDTPLQVVGGKLFFTAAGSPSMNLYTTDGTGAGTVAAFSLASLNPQALVAKGNDGTLAYFVQPDSSGSVSIASNVHLWRSDGTAAGTFKVYTFVQEPGTFADPGAAYNGRFYFFASDGVAGSELWSSDGTSAGTQLVKEIHAGAAGADASAITVAAGLMWFAANDGVNGRELWRSDGTAAGTYMVSDIYSGPLGSSPQVIGERDGYLYFSAYDAVNGLQVWKSDGSGANTSQVSSLAHPIASISAGQRVPGGFVVAVNDGVLGNEPWYLQTVFPPPTPSVAAFGDIDGDGHADLAWVDAAGQVRVAFMSGATATSSASFTLPPGSSLAGFGDYDGDGRNDLVIVNADGTVSVAVFQGAGFGPPIAIGSVPPDAQLAGIANLAARVGAALATKAGQAAGGKALEIVWRSRKGGRFIVWTLRDGALSTREVDDHSGNGWATLGIGDLDGDGAPEGLVMSTAGFVRVVKLDGAAAGALTQVPTKAPGSLAGIGDLEGVRRADLVWQGADGTLTAWRMDAGGIESQGVLGTLPPGASVARVADLTGDGKADLVVRLASGALQLWTVEGLHVTSVQALPDPGAGWTLVVP